MSPHLETAAIAAVLWPVVTGIVNAVLSQKTDEEWVELCEKSPKLAAVSKFLKAAGFNPAGAIKAFRAVFAKNVDQ